MLTVHLILGISMSLRFPPPSSPPIWKQFQKWDVISPYRLTALTVHALSSITLQRYSDPGLLKSALTWMHSQQNEDGSFADSANNATLSEKIDTTAFVLTCLSDVQHDDIVRPSITAHVLTKQKHGW